MKTWFASYLTFRWNEAGGRPRYTLGCMSLLNMAWRVIQVSPRRPPRACSDDHTAKLLGEA